MGDPIWVDPRTAAAALGTGPHAHNLGALQVVRGRPSGLEGQWDETVGSAFRAGLHGSLMVPPWAG
jgi:hypothetical protein